MKDIKKMTEAELRKAAAEYDRQMNEGGDGWNPYKEELKRREREKMEAEWQTPKGRIEKRIEEIKAEISVIEWRNCAFKGDQEKVAQLRQEKKELEAKLEEIKAREWIEKGWTPEETQKRREKWNAAVLKLKPKFKGRNIWDFERAVEKETGIKASELRCAVRFWKKIGKLQ